MPSKQESIMDKSRTDKMTDTEDKAANKANAREQTPPCNRSTSKSPAISSKTMPEESAYQNKQNKTHRPGGAFATSTFGPETMGWTAMETVRNQPQRERGLSIMPEPETQERMKELARKGAGKA